MEGDFIRINKGLLPLSWLYGLGVRLRNACYDAGILKSRAFPMPVISVGNITVGGTGKTPHVEYLIRLLQDDFHIAVLSRGYKRKTSGYLKADSQSTASDIGDEPFQMKQKFPGITVAVDRQRVHGIEQLTADDSLLDAILLDDAFQHRHVKPGINILLVDYHRLITSDKLLPAGRLREPVQGKKRADIVIITKCPQDLKPMDFRVLTKTMDLYPYQQLFFTTMAYDSLCPVFESSLPLDAQSSLSPATDNRRSSLLSSHHVLLLTGIASPQHLVNDLKPYAAKLSQLVFPDHHDFTPSDVERINQTFAALPSPRMIVTTEKDAARIKNLTGLSDDVRQHLYALPIRIQFLQPKEQQLFNQTIIDYVRNSRCRFL